MISFQNLCLAEIHFQSSMNKTINWLKKMEAKSNENDKPLKQTDEITEKILG